MNLLRKLALEKVVGPEAVSECPDDGKAEVEKVQAMWDALNKHAIELADLDAGLERGRVECIITRLQDAVGAYWYEQGMRDGAQLMLQLLQKDSPASFDELE